MNNLQIFNNQVVVSSRIIAKELNKEHSKVIRTLEQILEKPNVASLIIPHDIGLWDKDNINSNFDINTSDGNNKIAKIYNNVYALQTLPI